MKFSRKLSQLEAITKIADPVVESVDPVFVSDFIHTVFENRSEYGIKSDLLTPEWFSEFSETNPSKAIGMISNILQESGHIISHKSLLEGIAEFNKDFESAV